MSRPRCVVDVCQLFKPTGVCCPADSCDLETGVRTWPRIPTAYHAKIEIEHPVRRASGECICEVCGKDYYHHPRHVYSNYPNGRNEFGPDPWALVLIETCKGEKFKL